MNNNVPFKTLEEKGYLYQLKDGTILKIEFHLQRLTRTPLGLTSEGTMKNSVVVPGTNLASFQQMTFTDPDCIQRGSNMYSLPENGKTVRVVPQLRLVERSVDNRGIPKYTPTGLDWFPEPSRADMLESLARPGRTFISTSREETVTAVTKEKGVLEWLFPTGWFARKDNQNHPAYAEWQMCNQMIQWGGFKPDAVDFEYMRTAAKVAIDAFLLIRLSEGDLKMLTPGRYESFGDENVQRKISSRIEKAESFEDTLVELYTAGWHKRDGRSVTLSETEGYPDVRVKFDSMSFPIFIECKRISVISENRIQSVIKKASNQIEVASKGADANAYGAALLDLTGPPGARFEPNETIPPHILEVIRQVGRTLSGNKNTHVKSAVVVWDGYHVTGKLPNPVVVQYRRSARIIQHSLNNHQLTIDKIFDGYFSGLVMQPVADEHR